jgi:serine/threonine-protein kinase
MPTRADVDLARAAIDRGLLTIKESVRCLEIQRDYEQKGRQVPLELIFVKTKLITEQQLDQLKKGLARTQALRRIGQYELMAKVGTGGMGTVYKARDTKADRVVALKVLSPGLAGNKDYVRRFLREALASGRLSHENIVQGIDAGEADRHYYFAMEFIEGTTVAEMLKDGQAVPEQQALDIAIQIAKALRHAEESNLIHRDIKPDNIMLTDDGTAKLADLGLARLAVGAAREQGAFGTAYYASPEQCEGAEELDSKTDMYAFGATLYHMLSGHVPFDGETPEDILVKHLKERRPYLKDENVQLTHGVSKVVRKLMAIDPRDRYPSFDGVVKDLTLVRMGRSPRLGKQPQYESGEYRYRSETGTWRTKPARRWSKPLKITAAVLVALGIIAGGLFVVYEMTYTGPALVESGGTTPPGASTTPPSAALTEAAIYYKEIKARLDDLPRDRRLQRLRSVVVRYPDTPQSEDAQASIDAIRAEIDAEVRPAFEAIESTVQKLRGENRFQAALDKLDTFPTGYEMTPYPAQIEELRSAVRAQAERRFDEIRKDAEAKLKAKEYDEARSRYRPVVEQFGIDKYVRRARSRIREIERRKKALADKLAEQKRRREREAKLRRERRRVAGAIKRARELVKESQVDPAGEALIAAANPLELVKERRTQLLRAGRDLVAAAKLAAALTDARAALKGKSISLVARDGTRLDGEIFSVSDTRLSVQTADKAIRAVTWKQIPPDGLLRLTELRKGGKLEPTDRYALSTLFLFSGDADAARAHLDAVPDSDKTKDAVKARRDALSLFVTKAEPDDDGEDGEADEP